MRSRGAWTRWQFCELFVAIMHARLRLKRLSFFLPFVLNMTNLWTDKPLSSWYLICAKLCCQFFLESVCIDIVWFIRRMSDNNFLVHFSLESEMSASILYMEIALVRQFNEKNYLQWIYKQPSNQSIMRLYIHVSDWLVPYTIEELKTR